MSWQRNAAVSAFSEQDHSRLIKHSCLRACVRGLLLCYCGGNARVSDDSVGAPRGYLEQIWIRTRLINLPGTVIVKRRTPVLLRGSFPPLCLEAMSLRGYFVAFSKCALLLCLRILLLVPAGLPVRSQGDSQSDNRVMDNITVRQGETVFLR